jgi:hypothetical protein
MSEEIAENRFGEGGLSGLVLLGAWPTAEATSAIMAMAMLVCFIAVIPHDEHILGLPVALDNYSNHRACDVL